MKKLLISLLVTLMALPAVARDFSYEYEGQTLYYTVIDENAKTCEPKSGNGAKPGNRVSGSLVIPAIAKDGDVEYSVTSIGIYAFKDCSGMTTLSIPNSVTTIGSIAFAGCSGLTTLSIPNSVTTIYNNAFEGCSGLTTLSIPNSVTTIYWSAFQGCRGLTTLSIPNSVTSIGSRAFAGCRSLTKVDILGDLEMLDVCAFSGCENLKTVNIPGRVSTIAKDAFEGCGGAIENVGLGNLISNFTLNTIFPEFDKEKLKSAEIYESASIIVESAFQGCSNLTSVKFDTANLTEIQQLAFQGCSKLTEIELPEGLEEIGDGAFGGCRRLHAIILPNSLLTLGEGAFEQCFDLTEITVGDNLRYFGDAFSENNLQQLTIGKAIERLTVAKFTDDPGRIKSLILLDGIETIGLNAAKGCRGLREINFPNTLKTIDGEAFSGCDGLIELTIPNSVSEIRYDAFYGCDGLETIRLGSGLQRIGQKAFQNCHPLEIYVNSQNPPRGYFTANEDGQEKNTFNDYTATLYVPADAIDAYKSDSVWKNFTNIKSYDFSGVDEIGVDREEIRCVADGGTIMVKTRDHQLVEIYDISGMLCLSAEAVGGEIRFTPSLPGVYVVRCGTAAQKVMVK